MSNKTNVIGLQIGGKVGSNDIVGMHIAMPTHSGVGVSVDINNTQIDNKINEFISNIPKEDRTLNKVRAIANEILVEQNRDNKLQKISTLINIASGITTIATALVPLKSLIGL